MYQFSIIFKEFTYYNIVIVSKFVMEHQYLHRERELNTTNEINKKVYIIKVSFGGATECPGNRVTSAPLPMVIECPVRPSASASECPVHIFFLLLWGCHIFIFLLWAVQKLRHPHRFNGFDLHPFLAEWAPCQEQSSVQPVRCSKSIRWPTDRTQTLTLNVLTFSIF